MVLIRLIKEPLTEDTNARELAANGGGGPVQSTIHQVMKMISLSNIGWVIKACNTTHVDCTSEFERRFTSDFQRCLRQVRITDDEEKFDRIFLQ